MSHKGVMGLNPKTNNSHVFRSRKTKLKRKTGRKACKKCSSKVLKMLAVMEASQSAGPSHSASSSSPSPESSTPSEEFLSSGRTGRRNALPDILGQHAVVTSSDLPSRLQALSTTDKSSGPDKDGPSTSSGKS